MRVQFERCIYVYLFKRSGSYGINYICIVKNLNALVLFNFEELQFRLVR